MQKVAVGIIIQKGSVLICQRKKDARYGLKWEFPGGKVEEGETIQDCVHRELQEELSIEAGPIRSIETEVSHYDDGSSYEVHFCFVDGYHGNLSNNVFESIRWVQEKELQSIDFLEGNRSFIMNLVKIPFSERS
jgi:8-oxo-dGTP diphosphatase